MRLALVLASLALPLISLPAFADCADDIRAVMQKSANSGPYRIETETTAMGTTTKSVLEIIPQQAQRSLTLGEGMAYESIFVGERGFMNMDGNWIEMPAESAKAVHEAMTSTEHNPLDDLVEPVCAGESVVDGMAVLNYSYDFRTDELISHNIITVDKATGLPTLIVNESNLSGAESRSTARYSYDAGIAVSVPAGF